MSKHWIQADRRDGDKITHSSVAGTLLRTKLVDFDDGGVAAGMRCCQSSSLQLLMHAFAGVAVLDSPFLVKNASSD